MSPRGISPSAASRCASRRSPSRPATRPHGPGSGRRGRDLRRRRPGAAADRCLFGTGLKRGLERCCCQNDLSHWSTQSPVAVACDLPSGVDERRRRRCCRPIPTYDLTVTFGALKPAHRLMPAMAHMGRVVLADIGIDARRRLARDRPARRFRRSTRRAQISAAAWSTASPARCPARSRSPPRRPRAPGPAMSGSAPRARSTACPPAIVQTDTADGQRRADRLPAGRARAWATSRRC